MADQINELKQTAHDVRTELRAILRKQSNNEATPAEAKTADRLEAELTRLEQDILVEERRLGAEDARLMAKHGLVAAADDDAPAMTGLPALPSRTRAALVRLYPQAASADREQREANWRGVVQAALGGMPLHPSVMAATATEGMPSDGGFTVTPDVALGIITRAVEESVWLRIGVRLQPMNSDETIVNAVDDADETDDLEASIKAEWKDEASEGTAQIVKFRQCTLKARKLLVIASASNELAEDSPQYVAALEGAVSRAIGKRFDRAVLSGTGAGNPLGLLNSPATIVVSKDTGQPAATFQWENATKMWSRLAPGSHERAWWLIHPTVLPQGLSMVLIVGTAGTQPLGAFQAGGPTGYLLLGRPVLVTSRVKVLGTKGDVILADPTQLAVGVRRGITIERSQHALFTSDQLAVRGKFRGDARPIWDKPRTLVDGLTTVSPVVVLENR